MLALAALQAQPAEGGRGGRRRSLGRAIEEVARALGNSPTLCKKCYVHPELITAYLEGLLPLQPAGEHETAHVEGLSAQEGATLRFLRGRAGSPEWPTGQGER